MITGYVNFMTSKKILPAAVAFIIGGIIKEFLTKVNKDFIVPLSHTNYKKVIDNIKVEEYVATIIGIVIQTFIIYMLTKQFLEDN